MHNCSASTTSAAAPGLVTDATLVRRARRGDADAFDALCRRHRPAALAAARSVAPYGGEAEDAVQDALIVVARRLSELREDTNFAGYLAVVARRLAVRRATRRGPLLSDAAFDEECADDAGRGCPELAVLRREETANVASAMRALPERQRLALVRTAVAGDSYAVIGDDLGLDPNAVAQLVHRARVNVRGALAATGSLALAA